MSWVTGTGLGTWARPRDVDARVACDAEMGLGLCVLRPVLGHLGGARGQVGRVVHAVSSIEHGTSRGECEAASGERRGRDTDSTGRRGPALGDQDLAISRFARCRQTPWFLENTKPQLLRRPESPA
eukprot:364611-Prymnesium_polylepis.1